MKFNNYSNLFRTTVGAKMLLAFNLIVGLGAFIENMFIQAFCQPVLWASIVLIMFLLSLFIVPFLFIKQKLKLLTIAMFMQGVGVLVCIYCIWFIFTQEAHSTFVYVSFFTGVFSLSPLIYLIQIVFNFNILMRISGVKNAFLLGIFLPMCVVIYFTFQYKYVAMEIEKSYKVMFVKSNKSYPESYECKLNVLDTITQSYIAERIIGMHFKYHTRMEYIYDGWRPPRFMILFWSQVIG